VNNITDALDEACQYVDEIAGTAYEKTDDATNGRISDAIDTFKDTIDSVDMGELKNDLSDWLSNIIN
jgi:hypothetical protein